MQAHNPAAHLPTSSDQETPASGSVLKQIQDLLKQYQTDKPRAVPPVDQWNPARCGDMDLTIKANGEWWHEGSKINRDALVQLFSSVLWREGDDYFLKTPGEKLKITVEDAPFLVTQIEKTIIDGKAYLSAITQTGDVIVIDATHAVVMREFEGEARPYIPVRWNMDALIQRSAFYHLLNEGEFVEQDGQTRVKLHSGDFEFYLGAATE